MRYVEYAKRRYDAAIREIERLEQSEFPYVHIQDALLQLKKVFHAQRDVLDKLTSKSSPAVAKQQCSASLAELFNYTPYLGFVLRATNVRNAFEAYAPVLRLARQLLGKSTKLLLSSEWEYSPFVYLPTNELPDFVLIGVPAYESSNPLLVSLAGHELGHNVWTQQALGQKFDTALREEVLKALQTPKLWNEYQQFYPKTRPADLSTDMFAKQSWLPAHLFAKRQAEEIYCDAMGLRLFSEAYLHAFAYLLSPGLPGERLRDYPAMQSRVAYLSEIATGLGIQCTADYTGLFDTQMDPVDPMAKFLLSVADVAVQAVVPELVRHAIEFADGKALPRKSVSNVLQIRNDFQIVLPATGGNALTDIVNAGWECLHDDRFWNGVPHIREEDHSRVLIDLVLKSFEVAEYAERIATT